MAEGQPNGIRFNSLNEVQASIQWWQERTHDPDDLTPLVRFYRAMLEVDEARAEAEVFDGSPEATQRFGSEIADYIFASIGVLGALGVDLEGEMVRILDTNHRKYNVVQNGALRANGMGSEDAMAHQKLVYQNGNNTP